MDAIHGVTQGTLIERLGADHGDRPALVYPQRGLRWTYADLDARSLALARGLIAVGIEPGDHVCVWADNRPDWIPFQFAIARIGAVLVTANTALTAPEIEYLLGQSKTRMVVCAPGREAEEYLDVLAALIAGGACPRLARVTVMEGTPRDGMISVDELVAAGESVPASVVYERCANTPVSAPANIQYTSGTTGFPKGVVLSHENLVENAYVGAMTAELVDRDVMMLMVPLFHCFGCSVVVLGATTHLTPIVALQRFDPGGVLEAVESEAVTLIHGVPAMFRALLAQPDVRTRDLSSLRSGIVAGSMCPEPLMRRIHDDLGVEGICAAYGLTEASPGVTISNSAAPLEQRIGSVGIPYSGVRLRIVDPVSDVERPVGETGEVLVNGPGVMLGYFDDPEATSAVITAEGWLRTGDLGFIDEEGALHIAGRIKELVIRGGENVFPGEVEDALRTHADVADAAVFGVAHERLGEEVAAAVVLCPGASVDAPALTEWLATCLASYKRPRQWLFVDGFPLTASGKVQKFKLRQMAEAQGPRPSGEG
ncbi:MAG: AMP-binding protein [Planctomycetes bacterium]|nr:AMP-binding protein [Planctomycetota bacterium]